MSIGSDAVLAAEEYYARGCTRDGSTAIEQISDVYGKQAVVVGAALTAGCCAALWVLGRFVGCCAVWWVLELPCGRSSGTSRPELTHACVMCWPEPFCAASPSQAAPSPRPSNARAQISIDPRRVYVSDPAGCKHTCLPAAKPGPNGEQSCWWQVGDGSCWCAAARRMHWSCLSEQQHAGT